MSPISPMPQLARDGIEKSGTSRPGVSAGGRDGHRGCCLHDARSRGRARSSRATPSRKSAGGGQQAHHDERLVRKVEEVAGMREHVVVLEQVEHERLLAAASPARG